MSAQISEKNHFLTLLENRYAEASTLNSLSSLRLKAWERFLELGLPSRQDEVFQYVPLRHLYDKEFAAAEEVCISAQELQGAILPECANAVLVFVNGCFQPSLSRLEAIAQVSVMSIEDALERFGGFLVNSWTKSFKEENDAFVLLNAALHSKGAFLYVPPKTVLTKPIQILQVSSSPKPALISLKLSIFAGAQSQVQVVSTQLNLSGEGHCHNVVVDLHLEENAHLKYCQVTAPKDDQSWHFNAYRGTVKKQSVLTTVDLTNGSQSVRSDYKIALAGERAEALLNNLWLLCGKREAHSHVLMDHQAPNCHSMQLFKGALAGFSRSSFEGKILVRQQAQKTDAFQLNNNLLLNERTCADSKPNLEIFADDVKASHGATFGQLDAEHLFYMQSRGFSPEEAKQLLVYGYYKEILELIFVPSLLKKLHQQVPFFLTQG